MARRSRKEQVETTDIADGTIETLDLKDGQVTTSKVSDGAITTVKLSDKSVTTSKGSPLFVTTGLLADKVITSAKGSPLFVTSTLIADTAVTTSKIEAKAVTRGKQTYLAQVGSFQVTSRTTPAYKVFPIAYTGVPEVVAAATYTINVLGDVPVVWRTTTGSFSATGSPSGYVKWISQGSA